MLIVRFKSTNRTRCFNFDASKNIDFKLYDDVLIKLLGKEKCAQIIFLDDKVKPSMPILNLNCIRKPNIKEREILKKQNSKKKSLSNIFIKKTLKHGLKLKLADIKYNVNKKLFTFFTKSTCKSTDLTELKRDLSYALKTKVELKELSPRDEARRLGGIGPCGKKLCCSSFLTRLQGVSIKTVKAQNMPLNPARISGVCGKLLCCLNYEENNYKEKNKLKLEVDPSILLEKCNQKELETKRSNVPNYY